ncbi:protein PROPEP914-like [Trifolium pratense]|uniref:protein PROPEP914-like n=1 Tax=Trifolium pratense TaxID=57577 RepID=UPI001E6933A6|nr:protein PROPEP914-like [Trifolium pratense]
MIRNCLYAKEKTMVQVIMFVYILFIILSPSLATIKRIDYFLSLIFGRTMVKRNASRNDKLETMPQPTNSRITIVARDAPRGHNY